jgi:hypothetical protein
MKLTIFSGLVYVVGSSAPNKLSTFRDNNKIKTEKPGISAPNFSSNLNLKAIFYSEYPGFWIRLGLAAICV